MKITPARVAEAIVPIEWFEVTVSASLRALEKLQDVDFLELGNCGVAQSMIGMNQKCPTGKMIYLTRGLYASDYTGVFAISQDEYGIVRINFVYLGPDIGYRQRTAFVVFVDRKVSGVLLNIRNMR